MSIRMANETATEAQNVWQRKTGMRALARQTPPCNIIVIDSFFFIDSFLSDAPVKTSVTDSTITDDNRSILSYDDDAF